MRSSECQCNERIRTPPLPDIDWVTRATRRAKRRLVLSKLMRGVASMHDQFKCVLRYDCAVHELMACNSMRLVECSEHAEL